jgi:hypothetical protein
MQHAFFGHRHFPVSRGQDVQALPLDLQDSGQDDPFLFKEFDEMSRFHDKMANN